MGPGRPRQPPTERQAEAGAEHAQHRRLAQEEPPDLAPVGPEGAEDADLATTLRDADAHRVVDQEQPQTECAGPAEREPDPRAGQRRADPAVVRLGRQHPGRSRHQGL